MYPKIVISSDTVVIDAYISNLSKINNISSFNIYKVIPLDAGIGIDQIREVFSHIATKSPEGRMVVIYRVDNATVEAQNALLKILEDRTDNNLFILTGNTVERILPTIKSRTRIVILDRSSDLDRSASIAIIKKLYEKMKIKNTYSFFSDMSLPKTREDAILYIDDLIRLLHSLLPTSKEGNIPAIIKKAFETKNNILYLNCNHQLAFDNLLIFIHKTSTMK